MFLKNCSFYLDVYLNEIYPLFLKAVHLSHISHYYFNLSESQFGGKVTGKGAVLIWLII